MTKITRIAVALLSLSAFAAGLGCAGSSVRSQVPSNGQDTGKRHTGMAQPLLLTESDQGGLHALGAGQDVTIQLNENPTTGYRWSLDVEPAGAVDVADSGYTPGGTAPGAAGKREFHLRTKAPGTVHLRLKLGRAWQDEGSAMQRCEFVLQVGQ